MRPVTGFAIPGGDATTHDAEPVLENELRVLQSLADALIALHLSCAESSSAIGVTTKDALATEFTRVKQALTESLFSPAKDYMIERYVQHHQLNLAAIADQLDSLLNQADSRLLPQGRAELLRYFIAGLLELLSHLQRFFSKYFNYDNEVPRAQQQAALLGLNPAARKAVRQLEKSALPPELSSCVHDYLDRMTTRDLGPISFRQLVYFKEFLAEISPLFKLKSNEPIESRLTARLLYLNFNHLGFYAYYQDLIRREKDDADTIDDQLEILMYHQSTVKGSQLKPAISYDIRWPSIKTMLDDWLREELAQAEMIRQRMAEDKAGREKSEKMEFNQSVAQFALLLRLLYEEDCFNHASVADLLRFVIKHFRSKRQMQISLGSLSKEYYAPSQISAAVVRDLCKRMVSRINSQYFPAWAAGGILIYALSAAQSIR